MNPQVELLKKKLPEEAVRLTPKPFKIFSSNQITLLAVNLYPESKEQSTH